MGGGLGSLEIELLSLILELVVDNSPGTTKSLALVNKHLYSTAKLVGHRHKKIEYGAGDRGKRADLKPWLANDELLRGVRCITVEGGGRNFWQPDREGDEDQDSLEGAKYDDLITLISKLGNLKSLIWSNSDAIPATGLEALHGYHKKAELKLYSWTRRDVGADHTDPDEIALSKSPALSLIRATIWVSASQRHTCTPVRLRQG